ncbi:MAG: hypothetical protein E7462_00030 [Ruminococcaceae bacterium]|nr:hypothetical protein [Oscillospiraceae bacterium]
MKRYLKPVYLPYLTVGCSVIALLMRMWFFLLGKDARGLLAVGSFPDIMSWLMIALVMALLVVSSRKLKGGNKYSHNFCASSLAAIGMLLAAAGFLITSIVDLLAQPDTFGIISAALGIGATASLGYLSYGRSKGIRLSVLFHGVVCLFLMFHLVSHYRLWSSFPQLQSYAFELLAIVFVMLSGYQRAAFDADIGNRRTYAFFSYTALFFCIAALPGCDNFAFFIGCAAWMLSTPCNLHEHKKEA